MMYCKNFITLTSILLDLGPELSSLSKTLFLEFEGLYITLNDGEEGSWASHTKTHCGHCCCNKNFGILPTSDLHQLADDADGNHNYIASLFILQTPHSESSFHYLECFLSKS